MLNTKQKTLIQNNLKILQQARQYDNEPTENKPPKFPGITLDPYPPKQRRVYQIAFGLLMAICVGAVLFAITIKGKTATSPNVNGTFFIIIMTTVSGMLYTGQHLQIKPDTLSQIEPQMRKNDKLAYIQYFLEEQNEFQKLLDHRKVEIQKLANQHNELEPKDLQKLNQNIQKKRLQLAEDKTLIEILFDDNTILDDYDLQLVYSEVHR